MSTKISYNSYNYGSFVYGTNTDKSDRDYAIVLDDIYTDQDFFDYLKDKGNKYDNYDYHIYSLSSFKELIEEMDFKAIECLLLPSEYKFESFDIPLYIDVNKLRHSASKLSSNSWVKAKKKLIVEKDYNVEIAIKSFYHSFRILHFAIQIVNYNKIVDWTVYNKILFDLRDKSKHLSGKYLYEYMFSNYREDYRELQTEFKKIVLKNK